MKYSKQELQQMEYEQLCSLVQEKVITWSEWIDAQPDLYEGYDEWLAKEGLERKDENALRFIGMVEDDDMLAQIDSKTEENSRIASMARQIMK